MIAARRLGHARPARLRGASDEMPAYDWRSPARELVAIVEFRILGSVEVADGELVRDLGGLRERTLLARLLLSAGQVVSAERLAEDLWAGQPPAHWMATLRVYISPLRRALGEGPFTAAEQRGRAMSEAEAGALARSDPPPDR